LNVSDSLTASALINQAINLVHALGRAALHAAQTPLLSLFLPWFAL
jgi:hypothetical protein